jgi:predicted ATPase
MDDLNFNAVRNALVYGARARCKAEVNLPPSYPRLLRASFEGGFLAGVGLEFSANLNCLIGGRGSGKSTALLAIRAALGDPIDTRDGDDPNDPDRMPDRTVVDFIDAFGTERRAVRERGREPHEDGSDVPITLSLQGFGQDESGRLARGYEASPELVIEFLEQFVDMADHDQRERDLIAALTDNAAEVRRTHVGLEKLADMEMRLKELGAQLDAAEKSRIEVIAKWAALLASEGPLLARLRERIQSLLIDRPHSPIDIDVLAAEAGVDPRGKRPSRFLDGADGLRSQLAALEKERAAAGQTKAAAIAAAADPALTTLESWRADQQALQAKLDTKQTELEAQGLKVQVGAVRDVAEQIERLRKDVGVLKERERDHNRARAIRRGFLRQLRQNREARFQRRKSALKRVSNDANNAAEGLTIHLTHERAGIRADWEQWLGRYFKFRTPRVERVARAITPADMAGHLVNGGASLVNVERDGEPFFDQPLLDDCLPSIRGWDVIFELETMRIEDHVRISVREASASANREFGHLSAGQQRSILLSIMLCAEGGDPLVLDQPEDHLDAPYIATALVGHLEAAKERRQVVIATHSPNLTVLGDAELVIPMYADAGHGAPRDPGAVDRPDTRDRVCALLEGGKDAFRRRGQRYGFRIAT